MNTAGHRPDAATAITESHDDQSGFVWTGAVIALSRRVTLSYFLHILPRFAQLLTCR